MSASSPPQSPSLVGRLLHYTRVREQAGDVHHTRDDEDVCTGLQQAAETARATRASRPRPFDATASEEATYEATLPRLVPDVRLAEPRESA